MTERQGPATPGEHHRKLEPFVGTFRADVRIWTGPGDPMRSTGTMVNAWDLGGRFLAQRYTRDPGDEHAPSFEGRGYWGYDDVTGRYEGFWIDTTSNAMSIETGDVDDAGATWTMHGRIAGRTTGETLTTRTVIRLLSDRRHTMEQFMTGPDGREFKTVEIAYERSS